MLILALKDLSVLFPAQVPNALQFGGCLLGLDLGWRDPNLQILLKIHPFPESSFAAWRAAVRLEWVHPEAFPEVVAKLTDPTKSCQGKH